MAKWFKMLPKATMGSPGGEMIQNVTRSDSLDRPGRPGGEIVHNCTVGVVKTRFLPKYTVGLFKHAFCQNTPWGLFKQRGVAKYQKRTVGLV